MSESRGSGEEPFSRHRGPITCVAAIPGTRRALSSGYDGLWAWSTSALAALSWSDTTTISSIESRQQQRHVGGVVRI